MPASSLESPQAVLKIMKKGLKLKVLDVKQASRFVELLKTQQFFGALRKTGDLFHHDDTLQYIYTQVHSSSLLLLLLRLSCCVSHRSR